MRSHLLPRIVWACLRKQPRVALPSALMVGVWGGALALTQAGLQRFGAFFRLWIFSGIYLALLGVLVGVATLVLMGATAALADDVVNGRRAGVGGALGRALGATGRLVGYAVLRLVRVRRYWFRERMGTAISLIVLRRAGPVAALVESRRMRALDPGRGTGLLLVATVVTGVVVFIANFRLSSASGGEWPVGLVLAAVAALVGLESLTGACLVNLTAAGDPVETAPRAPPSVSFLRASGAALAGSVAAALLFAGAGIAFGLAASAWAGSAPDALCPRGGDVTARCVTSALLYIALRAAFPVIYVVGAVALASARVRARALADAGAACAYLAGRIAERADRLRALPIMPLTDAERFGLAVTAVARSLDEFPPLHRPALRHLLAACELDGAAVGDAGMESKARRALEEAAARQAPAAWGAWTGTFLAILIVHAVCAVAYRTALAAPARSAGVRLHSATIS